MVLLHQFQTIVMQSKSFQCQTIDQLNKQLDQTISEQFQPTLALVFCSTKFGYSAISQFFTEKNIDMLGCSTAGEIVNDELAEESIVVLLMDMNRDYYSIQTVSYDIDKVYSNSLTIGNFAKDKFENPALVVMSGGISVDAGKIIAGLKYGIGKEVPIYGGLAADDLQMDKTYAFSNNFLTANGLSILIIDTDKIEVSGLASSGWEAFGGINTITKSEGNIVYSINDEPALDAFKKQFGFDESPESKENLLLTIQTNYPFQIIREDGTKVLRTPIVIDEENRALIMAGGVEQGDHFKFSNSPGFEVIEQTVEEFKSLKQNRPEADALVLFSCKGRHGAFGPVLEEEVEGLYNYWKKPMIGFLSYGEIGNTKNGVCEFHNETCSLMILKEKQAT